MADSALSFLHLAPIVAITLLVVASRISSWFGNGSLSQLKIDPFLVVFSIIGIASGSHDHHHTVYMLDPCFVYYGVLAFVAGHIFKYSRDNTVKAI
ncbi:hypothetical protein EDM53_05270 [Rickettsiales endosymbiont of Peranema trichophorum]|uniref:hypothetical protein n=1 Tax=Rickettsiales endosymbiont of Peranema trichophorum TaxID=2486577 RepID=UPI001022C1A9|nr:hypothetical protein [Rickettsiales endosymbiont of Peranema trichophorum]RZI45422.1 hypothetical protein EDM53_05270 [Rickettsiales endosymbiont of Peranema trichophorum]